MHIVYCTLWTRQCVQCTLYTAHCILHIVYWTLWLVGTRQFIQGWGAFTQGGCYHNIITSHPKFLWEALSIAQWAGQRKTRAFRFIHSNLEQHFTVRNRIHQLKVCRLNSMWLFCCNYISDFCITSNQRWSANQNISSNDQHISNTFPPMNQHLSAQPLNCAQLPHLIMKYLCHPALATISQWHYGYNTEQ